MPDQFAARVRPSGAGRPAGRDNPAGGAAKGIGSLQSGGLLGLVGRMRTWGAALVVAATALVGVLLSLAAGQDPGILLGFFVIVGSIVAVLGIRRGSIYLIFPMPALTLFVSAILVGKVHDAELSSSTAGLGAGFLQWIAGIFDPAVVATVLVVLIGGGRWLLGRQLITGTSQLVTSRSADAPARPGRPASGSRGDGGPLDGPPPRSPRSSPSTRTGSRPQPQFDGPPSGGRPSRPPREPREPRPDRDQWGEPGRPADRDRSVPPASSRPPQTPGRPAPPRDRTAPRPQQPRPQQPGPSWSPNGQRPSRPPRPQPPDGWTR